MTSYVSPVAFTTVAQSIPPNVFADMDRKVAAAVADGADVIDLMASQVFCRLPNSGIAIRMVLRLIGKPSFLPWRARLMVWRLCSPCLFRRAMLWHMRIRITPRIIA